MLKIKNKQVCFLALLKNKFNKIFLFTIGKRQRFILITVFLTGGLLTTQLFQSRFHPLSSNTHFLLIGVLAIATYFLSAWSLHEDLSRVEWFTLLILPTMFTLAVGLSSFLLPVRWITRLPVVFLYAVGIYALLLTENIYNVAVARAIQLLRAASAVGFLITLITAFLLFQTLFSFHLSPWLNFLGVFLITSPLFLQAFWAVKLEEGITVPVALYGFFFALTLAEVALAFSFWPLNLSLWALFLVAAIYAFMGMGQQYLSGRLFKRTAIEFFLVPLIIFLILIASTRWGG